MREVTNRITVSLMIDRDLYIKARELAEKEEKSFAWVATQALTDYIHEFDLDKDYLIKSEVDVIEKSTEV